MHLIIYTSKMIETEQPSATVLESIVTTAAERNRAHDISGVLLLQSGYFLQVLEGEENTLRELLEKIQNDPRHTQIVFHADQPLEQRSFANWSLDSFAIDTTELFDSETIGMVQKLYNKTFEMNPKTLIEFIKSIIDEADTFKIKNDQNKENGAD